MRKLFIIITIILSSLSINKDYTFVDKEINIFKKVEVKKNKDNIDNRDNKVLNTYYGYITAYGPDCKGCIGITASGFNVKNNIYYHDRQYGKVRIVAADKKIPFGTIVRIKYQNTSENNIAIVLDRGSAIGFNRNALFDLLYRSEKETISFGKRKATFEILRYGY